jgi:uncharacterized protein DUF2760
MRRIGLAFRVFFKVLFNALFAEQVSQLLAGEGAVEASTPAQPDPQPKAPRSKAPVRSDALNVLAALQREARFVDFVQESLTGYTDAQIGAAARDVHRGCAAVLERVFALRPLVEGVEGSSLEVPAGFEAARFRLVGNVTGQPPYRGQLCHHGWEATRCDLPEWTGSETAARIVVPAEIELK